MPSERTGETPGGRALRLVIAGAVLAVLAAGAVFLLRPARDDGTKPSPYSVTGVLSSGSGPGAEGDAGFARALTARPFRFPEDHGSHPDFRTEWWYFTGNLRAAAAGDAAKGQTFGFQLTFFRSALAPPTVELPRDGTAWRTRQAWMAHFAVGDFAAQGFRSFESWGREALGLAGARPQPLKVWLRGWSAEGLDASGFPLRLRAESPQGRSERVAIDLELEKGKGPVAQGEGGLSRKSAAPGNASYYYSLPRMPARGTLTFGGTPHAVTGLAWMDREWSTSSLAPDQVGWDWFSLQLADGRELMLYQLRRRDGSVDPASRGTLIERDGATSELRLGGTGTTIEVLERWQSPSSGVVYPARWRLRVPTAGLDLTVAPRLADQELRLSFRYWEGAVALSDRSGRETGSGFVELTGYAPPP